MALVREAGGAGPAPVDRRRAGKPEFAIDCGRGARRQYHGPVPGRPQGDRGRPELGRVAPDAAGPGGHHRRQRGPRRGDEHEPSRPGPAYPGRRAGRRRRGQQCPAFHRGERRQRQPGQHLGRQPGAVRPDPGKRRDDRAADDHPVRPGPPGRGQRPRYRRHAVDPARARLQPGRVAAVDRGNCPGEPADRRRGGVLPRPGDRPL